MLNEKLAQVSGQSVFSRVRRSCGDALLQAPDQTDPSGKAAVGIAEATIFKKTSALHGGWRGVSPQQVFPAASRLIEIFNNSALVNVANRRVAQL